MAERPDFIRHYSEIQRPDEERYQGSDELLSIRSPFARTFGLTRLGIHHEILPPGRRTSYPHAESHEEEFVYVIEGYPDVWIDGELYPLRPGDGVGFPAGTGIAHAFLNNSDRDVRLLVVGEAGKPENMCHYPLNSGRKAYGTPNWPDVPKRALGPHDGKPRAGTRILD
jgi:uncharacterized cupin superfamily protein